MSIYIRTDAERASEAEKLTIGDSGERLIFLTYLQSASRNITHSQLCPGVGEPFVSAFVTGPTCRVQKAHITLSRMHLVFRPDHCLGGFMGFKLGDSYLHC